MKKYFRYDYDNKRFFLFNWANIVFIPLIFVAVSVENDVLFWIALCCGIAVMLNSCLFTLSGIYICKNTILIFNMDSFSIKVKPLDEIRSVAIRELLLEKKSDEHGESFEYSKWGGGGKYSPPVEYVFNHGKVFEIRFFMHDGNCFNERFDWMYRETKKKRVDEVSAALLDFAVEINFRCKKTK